MRTCAAQPPWVKRQRGSGGGVILACLTSRGIWKYYKLRLWCIFAMVVCRDCLPAAGPGLCKDGRRELLAVCVICVESTVQPGRCWLVLLWGHYEETPGRFNIKISSSVREISGQEKKCCDSMMIFQISRIADKNLMQKINRLNCCIIFATRSGYIIGFCACLEHIMLKNFASALNIFWSKDEHNLLIWSNNKVQCFEFPNMKGYEYHNMLDSSFKVPYIFYIKYLDCWGRYHYIVT